VRSTSPGFLQLRQSTKTANLRIDKILISGGELPVFSQVAIAFKVVHYTIVTVIVNVSRVEGSQNNKICRGDDGINSSKPKLVESFARA
jgi:hypothetical protein